MPSEKFKSGFVSIVGQPNVGKSTLLNLLAGEKIAIISNKPQTTRNKIQAIVTDDDCQIVFIDTPGIHTPRTKLGEFMVKSAVSATKEVELVLYLVNPVEKISENDKKIVESLKRVLTPVILIINKIDTVSRERILQVIAAYKEELEFSEILPISAKNAENTEGLHGMIKSRMPEGPQYFPSDMITDQPERQILCELIREKILLNMQDEIPHGTAVEILQMKKREGKPLVDVEATIYCEKDSHKGMLIGKNGDVLKKIGTQARLDAEGILGSSLNLKLWVKVKKDWRDSDFLLSNFGYKKL